MAKRSAALLMFRLSEERGLEVLLGHMGGSFWEKKDARAWSIPKGEYEEGEEPIAVALREFEEEMGSPPPPSSDWLLLGESSQPSGKIIAAYATEGDFDIRAFHSNTFTMEWPKGSGNIQEFPESIARSG
jgi:predicted NUDIX family NTP pyrophosphohydrolase